MNRAPLIESPNIDNGQAAPRRVEEPLSIEVIPPSREQDEEAGSATLIPRGLGELVAGAGPAAGVARIEPIAPPLKTITLELKKQMSAYELDVDGPVPKGDLIVELSGPAAWPVPAQFDEDKNRIPLNGRTVIRWDDLEGPELRVWFKRFPDALKLQVESVYVQGAQVRRPPEYTVEKVEWWKNNLPQEFQRDVAEYQSLPAAIEQMRIRGVALERQLNDAVRRNDPRAGFHQMLLKRLQNEINKANRRGAELERELPKREAHVRDLPRLEHLMKSLHRHAQLHYRVCGEEGEK